MMVRLHFLQYALSENLIIDFVSVLTLKPLMFLFCSNIRSKKSKEFYMLFGYFKISTLSPSFLLMSWGFLAIKQSDCEKLVIIELSCFLIGFTLTTPLSLI